MTSGQEVANQKLDQRNLHPHKFRQPYSQLHTRTR